MSSETNTERDSGYSSNQLVVVEPDSVAAATRAMPTKRGSPAVELAFEVTKLALSVSLPLSVDSLGAWARARENGLNVTQISQSEAKALTFPPGHPRSGVLYVRHPAASNVYYTLASFHRMAFEHKFAEAIRLLMHLGATEIKVEHIRGWSREFSAGLSASVMNAVANVRADSGMEAGTKLLLEATLAGSTTPVLPDGLVWYPHEPTWAAIAEGRIKFGLSQFSLTINYEDDFGVNAGLKLSASKAGLEIGGKFDDHEATTWRLHGKFAPLMKSC